MPQESTQRLSAMIAVGKAYRRAHKMGISTHNVLKVICSDPDPALRHLKPSEIRLTLQSLWALDRRVRRGRRPVKGYWKTSSELRALFPLPRFIKSSGRGTLRTMGKRRKYHRKPQPEPQAQAYATTVNGREIVLLLTVKGDRAKVELETSLHDLLGLLAVLGASQ